MQEFYIDHSRFHNFISHTPGKGISTSDLTQWLESITANQFTIVKKQFIVDFIKTLNEIQIYSKMANDLNKKIEYEWRKEWYSYYTKFNLGD